MASARVDRLVAAAETLVDAAADLPPSQLYSTGLDLVSSGERLRLIGGLLAGQAMSRAGLLDLPKLR